MPMASRPTSDPTTQVQCRRRRRRRTAGRTPDPDDGWWKSVEDRRVTRRRSSASPAASTSRLRRPGRPELLAVLARLKPLKAETANRLEEGQTLGLRRPCQKPPWGGFLWREHDARRTHQEAPQEDPGLDAIRSRRSLPTPPRTIVESFDTAMDRDRRRRPRHERASSTRSAQAASAEDANRGIGDSSGERAPAVEERP